MHHLQASVHHGKEAEEKEEDEALNYGHDDGHEDQVVQLLDKPPPVRGRILRWVFKDQLTFPD